MRKKSYMNLCIKAISGSLSEAEQDVLDKWLNESEGNKQEFEQLQNTWTSITYNLENSVPNVDLEWNKLHHRILNESKSTVHETKWYQALPNILFIPAYKPAIAIIALIFIIAVYFTQIKNEFSPVESVSTNPGEKKTIILSDGSSIILNYSSSIQYPEKFSEIREVKLSGEAFFSVSKNTKRFKVKTVNAIVSVLGTKFTIKTVENKTDVFVKEGKVNLNQLSSDITGVNLSTGQKSFVLDNMSPSKPEIVDSGEALGWLNNVLTFNHTSLHEIKAELERLYGITILIQKEELGNLTLTGSFKVDMPVDSTLDMVCLALDLKYEKLPGNYVLSTK